MSQHHLLEKDYFFFPIWITSALRQRSNGHTYGSVYGLLFHWPMFLLHQSCPSLPCPCFGHTDDLWNPWPGIKPRILAMESWSTNHWTAREFQTISWLLLLYNYHKIQYCGFSYLISFYNVFLVIVVLLLYHLMFKNELYL